MSLIVAYIAYVEPSTGEIIYSSTPASDIPPDGSTVNGLNIKYIFSTDLENASESDIGNFCEKYYWRNETWTNRGLRPNKYYTWNYHSESWEFRHETILAEARFIRNQKLAMSDWTQANDSPLSEEKKLEWRNYRHSLREITDIVSSDIDDPENISWPTEPS